MEKIKEILHVGSHKHTEEHTNSSSDKITDPDYKKLHGTYENTSLDEHGRGVIPGKHYDEETTSSSSRGRQLDHTTSLGSTTGPSIVGTSSSTGTSSGLAGTSHASTSGAGHTDPAYTSKTTTTTTHHATSGLYSGIQGEILPGPASIHGAVVSEGTSGYTPALQDLRQHGLGDTDAGQYDTHLSGYSHGVHGHSLGHQKSVQDPVAIQQPVSSGLGSSGLESTHHSSGLGSSHTTASQLKSTGYNGEPNTETKGVKAGLSQAWAESQGNP